MWPDERNSLYSHSYASSLLSYLDGSAEPKTLATPLMYVKSKKMPPVSQFVLDESRRAPRSPALNPRNYLPNALAALGYNAAMEPLRRLSLSGTQEEM
jgi:hypothetical protein